MNIYAIICTRETPIPAITSGLVTTLQSYGAHVKVLANRPSIFSAYQEGLELCRAKDEDVVIFCHDDIQLMDTRENFHIAMSHCLDHEAGIIGPAGSTELGADAVWWDKSRWEAGLHKGTVKHVSVIDNPTGMKSEYAQGSIVIRPTYYGPIGQVVVLDGLFLAAQKSVWDKVGLEKPDHFEGEWDFYDIHYTTKAHKLGLKNKVVGIDIIHHSNGELVGRDSWHKNREAFIKQNTFPIKL